MAQLLIVDDEYDGREALSRFLVKSGHQVSCANDGRDALAQMLSGRNELILLDVRMPRMDGIALLEVLRSYLRLTDIPVIVVTGEATPDEMRRARDLGVCHIFHKASFTFEELGSAVDECLKSPN